ncbi:DUF2306 domain-containing protein [Paenibacillus sacheonensis]|uniref:DUF2306 domain-containing protein n=1 Tax=Paenibacillus sacheonensis TaxID=742054 RepID=A0A7X5C082_9BACL|nr:DUF2306 domain-containing protein [Paenibacillus sacheonensis]MBM7567601.1 hypothetical protein [Paenibacillus sacheonensis]NBC71296.1 DUF2306 domain-containing protein [Paenibacillus sacheonensis]
MPKTNRPYVLLLMVIAALIAGYALYRNILQDPEAAGFLSHKTNPLKQVDLPVWLSVMRVHLGFACLAMLAGAVNFSPWVLRHFRRFHKRNGYAYLISVLAVSLTSGYMAPYATGGKAVSIPFNMLNILWPAFTVLAIISIRKRRILQHRQWMVRSYAFCFTNMAVHLLAYVFREWADLSYEAAYTAAVYGAIVLLQLLAELFIRLFMNRTTAGFELS